MAKHSENSPIILANNYSNSILEAGCDEAGRGCLAGPVVAAAVILPLDYHLPGLNDSKQLNEKKKGCASRNNRTRSRCLGSKFC